MERWLQGPATLRTLVPVLLHSPAGFGLQKRTLNLPFAIRWKNQLVSAMNSLDMIFRPLLVAASRNDKFSICNPFQSGVLVLGLNLQGGNHHLRYPYCFHRALEGLLVLISSLSDLLGQVKEVQNDNRCVSATNSKSYCWWFPSLVNFESVKKCVKKNGPLLEVARVVRRTIPAGAWCPVSLRFLSVRTMADMDSTRVSLKISEADFSASQGKGKFRNCQSDAWWWWWWWLQ